MNKLSRSRNRLGFDVNPTAPRISCCKLSNLGPDSKTAEALVKARGGAGGVFYATQDIIAEVILLMVCLALIQQASAVEAIKKLLKNWKR